VRTAKSRATPTPMPVAIAQLTASSQGELRSAACLGGVDRRLAVQTNPMTRWVANPVRAPVPMAIAFQAYFCTGTMNSYPDGRSLHVVLRGYFVPNVAGYSSFMVQKSIPESHRDLLDAEFATLATVGEDGYPQLSEVWFLAQDDQIALSLNTARQKLKNIETEPACTLLILDMANPYRYVEIRGTAVVKPDDDLEFAGRVGAKYDADLRKHDVPGDRRVTVRIVPVRMRAVDMSA
jgi:PPOX class probable F420-dependent enzyme